MKPIQPFLVALLTVVASAATATPPRTISYQGIITDNNGVVVQNGTYIVTFKLYDAATGGNLLWTETQGVQVSKGRFNAILGSITSLDPLVFDIPYWLGLAVENDPEMTPRIELTSSPYSLMARTVEDGSITSNKLATDTVVRSLNGAVNDDAWIKAGANVTITQNNDTLFISATGTGADGDWTVSGNNLYSAPPGNVGIGVASPENKLQVEGGPAEFVTSTGASPLTVSRNHYAPPTFLYEELRIGVTDQTAEFHYINDEANNRIDFRLENTDLESGGGANANDNIVMRITGGAAGGKVGIGTISPEAKLHIAETFAELLLEDTDAPMKGFITLVQDKFGPGEHAMQFGFPSAEGSQRSFLFRGNTKDLMVVKATGRVGIGTSDPVDDLHIKSTSGDADLDLENVSGKVWDLASVNADGSFGIYEDVPGSSRLSIHPGGNVGIGTTAPPTFKLRVDAQAGQSAVRAISSQTAISGESTPGGGGTGVYGKGDLFGVAGESNGTLGTAGKFTAGNTGGTGVLGEAVDGPAPQGGGIGGHFKAYDAAGTGVYAENTAGGVAGRFAGDVEVENGHVVVNETADSNPPDPGGYYADNAAMGWAVVQADGMILDDFGVASVTVIGIGSYRVTMDNCPVGYFAPVVLRLELTSAGSGGGPAVPQSSAYAPTVVLDANQPCVFELYFGDPPEGFSVVVFGKPSM